MKQIIHIVGNRPQFIKLAVLYKAIEARKIARQQILHTGQHHSQEMSGIFFDDLALPAPHIQLQIENTDPDQFIAHTTRQLQHYLAAEQPGAVMIYGDTNTTYAAAMAAARTGQSLHHFEAGVRTGDLKAPEEINRLLADRLSSVHYCCTLHNLQTLKAEGYGTAITATPFFTGDLMLDAYLKIPEDASFKPETTSYVACTIHRAEHILVKKNLEAIIDALNDLHRQIPVIVPLHPHTQKKITEAGLTVSFRIIPPLGYPQMKAFIKQAAFIITDSGGVSREAYFAEKPSLVVMARPVWPEIIRSGAGLACAPHRDAILNTFIQLAQHTPNYKAALFGYGNAAQNICDHLSDSL
ncbi:UDP-N-acetylglucosamine 2-epimerase [Niabella sp. CC-SYL272]|uniref:UDP-N-acetyl glucosamine 2-epimerase n=1 Tax=Niabella agricola TaxID=2891571 RepID=UPI001F195E09|nr:UDP-N-acetylglucosamine 2-epimerase [Niabella agricola]MCF3107934.1 UDP-N-acetylglucosamine 2-epimerase [Niabella agricola]